MSRKRLLNAGGRISRITKPVRCTRSVTWAAPLSNRARGGQANERLPFVPPEDWHEPREDGRSYRIVVQSPGAGYRHVVTPDEVRARFAELPRAFTRTLEVVQFSRMTRKKQGFPCYGMQWGAAIYLYPIETDLVERYHQPPKPNQANEARMYGGRWVQEGPEAWNLIWDEHSIKDFYLNNILIHELGHLLDNRNSRQIDRERFAEWFAIRYGYQPTRHAGRGPRSVQRRHHSRNR
ncbi:MAG TPA: hypothetical protein PK867_08085 [Pirellulales bacterium]|nr:hypothetical protein [Pirellulales bacterium]